MKNLNVVWMWLSIALTVSACAPKGDLASDIDRGGNGTSIGNPEVNLSIELSDDVASNVLGFEACVAGVEFLKDEARVAGCDISPRQIEKSRESGESVSFQCETPGDFDDIALLLGDCGTGKEFSLFKRRKTILARETDGGKITLPLVSSNRSENGDIEVSVSADSLFLDLARVRSEAELVYLLEFGLILPASQERPQDILELRNNEI